MPAPTAGPHANASTTIAIPSVLRISTSWRAVQRQYATSYPTPVLRNPVDLPGAATIGGERLLEEPNARLPLADFEAHADRAIAQAVVALEAAHAAFEAPVQQRRDGRRALVFDPGG